MPKALAESVQYAPVPVIPHWTVRPGSRGPQVAPDWPQRYLDGMERHGTQWLAAKQAGVSVKTVQRLREVDPAFADAEHAAVNEHRESLEQNLNRIAGGADMPAVTANIVRLKKLDPVGYVERNLSMSVAFTSELPSEDGKLLLQAMLGQGSDQKALPEPTA